MGFKTATQIILLIISLVIIFTYIKPTLIDIRATQDELFKYADAVTKADELNQLLSQQLDAINTFSAPNLMKLYEYLPDTIDSIQVMADIHAIASKQNIRIVSLTAAEPELPQQNVLIDGKEVQGLPTTSTDFSMELTGSYESLKSFLKSLEQNKYPIEIISLTFGNKVETGEVKTKGSEIDTDTNTTNYELIVRTYAYTASLFNTQ